jgi:hypothetical protein
MPEHRRPRSFVLSWSEGRRHVRGRPEGRRHVPAGTIILAGKHKQAERALREALTVFSELGDRNGRAEALNAYAAVAIAAGRPDVARVRQILARLGDRK